MSTTTPAPTPLRIENIELTWPFGAVSSRAGVDGGGVPVGMALRDVGGESTVVGGAVVADCRRGAVGRVVARVGAREEGGAAVARGAVLGGVVTGAEAGGAVGDGAVGAVTGPTEDGGVGSPGANARIS